MIKKDPQVNIFDDAILINALILVFYENQIPIWVKEGFGFWFYI